MRPREEVSGSSCLRSGEAESVYDILKTVSQTKNFFGSTLESSASTRKEAIKIIKVSTNKKKLIEFVK